jgi:hypothetical protein
MNIILDISQIETMNFVFLEKKKNIIVDGYFTKIIYSDPFVTLNSIYIYFPIQFQYVDKNVVKNIVFFTPSQNMTLMKEITQLEEQIIKYYKKEMNIQKMNNSSLYNQLKTGKIKIYKEYNNETVQSNMMVNSNMVLKISGVWETTHEIGIAYKFLEMYSK